MEGLLVNGPVTAGIIASVLSGFEKTTGTGGHSIFLGQVRADSVEGRKVTAISYSAYAPLAEAEAEKIISEILGLFNEVQSVRLLHSVGIVKAGEISLFASVSAVHRDQASKACVLLVEMVKERLPVWKKELFDDNSHRWIDGR